MDKLTLQRIETFKKFQTLLKSQGLYDGIIDGLIGSKSLSAASEYVKRELIKRKWVYSPLIFIRLDYTLTDTFDDIVCVYQGDILTNVFVCSTTAGSYYVKNPITYGGVKGTAIAKEQQVLNSHKFFTASDWKTLWLGGPFFRQMKDIEIYRDGNMDNKLDKVTLQKGMFGINLHRGGLGNIIYNWSAGCHVTPDTFWWQAIKQFKNGNWIHFTLIEA